MNFMKLKILISGLIIFSLFFLSGCGKKEKKTEIEFWTLQLSSFKPYIQDVIQKYEEEHPEVKINWVDVPFSEGEKRLLVAVLSKDVPDVVNMNPSFTSILASRGALQEINQSLLTEYIPQTVKSLEYEGKVYGVPWYVTSSITFYNEEILKNAGIKIPPKTYDDVINSAASVKKTKKYVIMTGIAEDGKILKIFSKYDIPIVKDDKAVFNTSKAAKILSDWQYMYKNSFIPKETVTATHMETLQKYFSGEVAMIDAGPNFLNIVKENSPDVYEKTGISQQLTGSNGKYDFALMNFVIPKNSKNKDVAVDFALFVANYENQLKFAKQAPVLSSLKKSLNDEFFIQSQSTNTPDYKINEARKISTEQLKNALDPIPQFKNRKELFDDADYMVQEVLLNNIEPSKALNEAVKKF